MSTSSITKVFITPIAVKKQLLVKILVVSAIIAGSTFSNAGDTDGNTLYLGSGAAKTGSQSVSSATPIVLGYIRTSTVNDFVWGLDFSGEGTKLDSTWGQNKSVKQANSYNLLLGKNISNYENSRFDALVLVGMRETTSDCPSSYIGYQCYADASPNNRYGLNYGAVLTWTYKSLMLGARVTGESTQALIGFKF